MISGMSKVMLAFAATVSRAECFTSQVPFFCGKFPEIGPLETVFDAEFFNAGVKRAHGVLSFSSL